MNHVIFFLYSYLNSFLDLHYYEKHVLEVEGRLKFIKSKIKSEVDALESDTEFNDINVLISRLKKKAAQVEAFGSKCSIMSSANIIVKNKEQKVNIFDKFIKLQSLTVMHS